jgi:hypothetical protein
MLSVEGDYNDLSEDTGYKLSAFSDTFADGSVGVLLTATYQDVEVRSDAVHEFFVTPDTPLESMPTRRDDLSIRDRAARAVLHQLRRAHPAEGTDGRDGHGAMGGQRLFEMSLDGMFRCPGRRSAITSPTRRGPDPDEETVCTLERRQHRDHCHRHRRRTVPKRRPSQSTVVDTTRGWNGEWRSNRLKLLRATHRIRARFGGKIPGCSGSVPAHGRVDMN